MLLPVATFCGMFRRTEVHHAKEKPIPYPAVACRGRRAVPASHEIYVAVLSGRPGQDDPPRRRRLGQRRDRVVPAYAARSRQPVAQALFRTTPRRAWRISRARAAPGLFPPEVVVQVKALACELPATLGLPLSRFSVADVAQYVRRPGWSRRSATARSGAGSMKTRSVRGSIAVGSFRAIRSSRVKAGRMLDLYQRRWQGQAVAGGRVRDFRR